MPRKKKKSGPDGYFVLENNEDGEVHLTHLDRSGLLDMLTEISDDERELNAFSARDILLECESGRGSWDFANAGPRGMVIFKAEAVIVPEAKKVKVVYEVPE